MLFKIIVDALMQQQCGSHQRLHPAHGHCKRLKMEQASLARESPLKQGQEALRGEEFMHVLMRGNRELFARYEPSAWT